MAKHNDVFCKDAFYSVSSGDYKYCIDVTFVNISDEINGTGDAFYIYKFNADTNEYEQVLWKDDTYYIGVEPTINVKDIYSTQFYLDKIYDIDNMENGLYIIEKDFQDRLVTVGEFIMVNGNLTFCN